MVDFANQAVDAIKKVCGSGYVGGGCGRGGGIACPVRIRACSSYIRRRPGVSGQQCRNHWINTLAAAGDTCFSLGNRSSIRHAARPSLCSVFALSLIIYEKESLVLDDRSAKRASILIVVERALWTRREIEIVPSSHLAAAKVFQQRSMPGVGPALRHNIHDGATVAPVFRLIVRECANFGHGINRQNRGWRAKNSRLVDRRIVSIAVVHISAIEQKVV